MPAPSGKVPILESAAAGFRFARENIVAAAAAAAIVAAPIALLEAAAQQRMLGGALFVGWALWLASLYVGVIFHAAMQRRALGMESDRAAPVRFGADEMRLAGAMSVVGFFLLIVSIPALFAAAIAFGTIAAPFASEIEATQGDPAATMEVLQQIISQRTGETLTLLAVLSFGWLALTSRLYLVAPATVAEGRSRTFETWAWTKGAMLRITAARLVLLVPIFLAVAIIQQAATLALGGPEQAAGAPLPLTAAVRFAVTFLFLMLYSAAEAGLSAYLYRGLRPPG